MLAGAAASLATSDGGNEGLEDEAVVHVGVAATPVQVWRIDLSLNEPATSPEGYEFGGAQVLVTAEGDGASGFASGALALHAIGDPIVTDPFAIVASAPNRVTIRPHCEAEVACSREMYLVVERRRRRGDAPLDVSVLARAYYGENQGAPDGASIDVTLTEVAHPSSIAARTPQAFLSAGATGRRVDDYEVIVETEGVSFAAPDVIGYASAWGRPGYRGTIDLHEPGVADSLADLDDLRFDQAPLDGGVCTTRLACRTTLALTISTDVEARWWTEARVIFLDGRDPPAGASVSMEADPIEE